MYYDDIEYARRRLTDTLVRKSDGSPLYVMSVQYGSKGSIEVLGHNSVSSADEMVDLRDIDLTPVPLGFLNLSHRMVYLCRKPMRKDWKQGLSHNSLVIYGADKRDVNLSKIAHTVLGKYPSVSSCVSLVTSKKGGSQAFSRDFGVVYDGGEVKLVYRKYTVGKHTGKDFVLDPDKFFLEQHLTESVR